LNKLQQHERGQDNSVWRSKGLFLASNQGSGYFDWDNDFIAGDNNQIQPDREYIERCWQLLLNQGEYTAGTPLYAVTKSDPEAGLVSSSLNDGVSLFYYLGHGAYDYFTTSGFNVAAANSLSNGNALPFVVSPVCHTGNFAVTAGDCLSEALLNNLNGGAAAILSCTGESFWKAPIVLFWKFTDSLLSERPRLPDTGTIALNSIIEGIRYCQTTTDDETGAQKYFLELMHLFGDSSQVLRLAGERDLQVEYEWTAAGLQVQLFWLGENGNIPVSGAKVCLELGTLGEYVSGCSNDAGQVLLPVEQIYPSYTLRILDASAPLQEVSLPNLDYDNNGVISHQEMLTWLSEWDATAEKPAQQLSSALAQWQASGSAETRQGVQQPDNVVPVYLPAELQLQIACPNSQELKRLHDAGAEILNFDNGIAYLEGRQELADRLAAAEFDIVSVSVIDRSKTRSADGYPSFEELHDELFDTAAQYATFCRLSLLGKSVQGREILALRVSLAEEGAEVPELLIVGGIHGDEPPGIEMVRRLLKYLCEQVSSEGTDEAVRMQNILQNCVLWLIPMLNPDGLVLGQRENANYADLNRNFPDGVVLEPENLGTFAAGDSLRLAGLQPEQILIMRWLAARRITAALHLHTGALKICYPYGNYKTDLSDAISLDDDRFKELALQYAGLNSDMDLSDPEQVENAAAWYRVNGELADWQYRFLGTLPWTVELVGPYENKTPPYDTMEQLWDANRPALLGWMEQIAILYPIGLSVSTRSNDGTWWAQFQFEQPQYLPGYQNPMKVQFGDFSSNVPTALILVSKTPLDWAISAGVSGLQPLASRPEEDNQTAWLFYPGESGWGDGVANFTLLPPEDTSNEAIFAAELFWDGGQWDCYPKHWLPLPEREIDFAWTKGWNMIAFPMILKASLKLPFTAFWEWRDNQFHNTSGFASGQGCFAYADTAGTALFSGWMTELPPMVPQNGWNFKGVLWKRRAEAQEQILILDNVHKVPQIQQEILPGAAFWLFQ
ncbi:MAG: M14 family zinc carboxypeptidase, partial [Lentisphaeria bacterium]